MEAELIRYKNYSRRVKWFLIISGLWPNVHHIIKRILSFISFFTIFVVAASSTYYCFKNATNIMMFTRGMGISVSFFSALMKVCIFLLHHEDLTYLDHFLSNRYNEDLKNTNNHIYLLSNLTDFTSFTYLHLASAVVSISMYMVKPLLILRQYGKYVLVYPTMFPFFYEPGGVVYWILYYIQVLAAWSLGTVTIGVDCVFGLYALQVCGESRILSKKFSDLRMDLENRMEFRECIERHYMLINVKHRMENLFGLITLWLAISGALVLCSLVFHVSESLKNHINYGVTCHLFMYIMVKFLQIFMYAWYGNRIADESRACLDSIYNSHWPDSCNTNFKNDLLIVLAQEPLILVAKGCIRIQLDMFTNIMKASVSYFHLLRAINEAE